MAAADLAERVQLRNIRHGSSFAYTLDLLIPFGAFGLRQAYGADGAGQWLGYALIASGWILATAVIAGITSAVRRD